MYIFTRPVCLALHTVFFLVLGDFLPVLNSARATPIPLPLHLMAADRSLNPVSVNRTTPLIARRNLLTKPYIRTVKPPRHIKEHARRAASSAELHTYYDRAKAHSVKLTSLAAKSANVQDDDLDFQHDFASELSGFNTNMLGFRTVLAQTDKGLANYDDTNDLETLVKDTVDFNKNVLSAVDVAVYNIPCLGPILGPIVYNLKCLIDGILDAIEDFTDATINALQPLLQALLGKAITTTCRSGVKLAGLCI